MRQRVGSAMVILGAAVFGLLAWQLQPQAANPCYRKEAAPLDCVTWKVPASFISDLPEGQITGLVSDLASKVPTSSVGAANGVCALDSATKISTAVVPDLSSIYAPWTSVEGTGTDTSTATNKLVNAADPRLSDARAPTGNLYADGNIALTTGTSTSTATSVALSASPKVALKSVPDSVVAMADVTNANVSTNAHGFAPKLPNDATRYLDGTGSWSIPPGTNTSTGTGTGTGTSVTRPSCSTCALYWDMSALTVTYTSSISTTATSTITYSNAGTAGALSLGLFDSNAMVSSDTGVYGKSLRYIIDNSTHNGLKTVATSVGESDSISVFLWVKIAVVNQWAVFAGKYPNPTDTFQSPYWSWVLRAATGGSNVTGIQLYSLVTKADGYHELYVPNASNYIPTNVWTHIGFTYNSADGLWSIYRNGVIVAQTSLGAGALNYSTHGRYTTGTDPGSTTRGWSGTIDDLRVYSTALSSSDAYALFTAAGLR